MGFVRHYPPEYRALVVENEREFRADLIYTIESMDLGISVVEEASDYEDAVEALAQNDIDLLITDINLTDELQFRVGDRDGTQLARWAREHYDIPAIFLTAFADYDAEVVTQATESDPIGFIQKNGSEVGVQIQHLIRLAMHHLELMRVEREGKRQLEAVVEHLSDGLLFLDGEGRILDVDERACEVLGYEGEDLLDQHWADVLRAGNLDSVADTRLAAMLASGDFGEVHAVPLKISTGEQRLFRVQLTSAVHLREPCTLLMLHSQHGELNDLAALTLNVGSSLLIVGPKAIDSDYMPSSQEWSIAMLDLRRAIAARVRSDDVVVGTQTNLVGLIMNNTDEATAFALSRSLLAAVSSDFSHQHQELILRAGLSHRGPRQSTNSTLSGAISALERAMSEGSDDVQVANVQMPSDRDDSVETTATAAPTRLKLGMEITAGVLDIPEEHVRSMDGFEAVLATVLKPIPGLLGFSLATLGAENDCLWRAAQPLRESSEALTKFLEDAPAKLPKRLSSTQPADTPSIVFHGNGEFAYALAPLVHNDRVNGMLALLLGARMAENLPPSLPQEVKLASVGSQHLGRLFAQLQTQASEMTAIESTLGTDSYNIHALRAPSEALSAAKLFLELDTPIALVGEPGMARADLLEQAAKLSDGTHARDITLLQGGDWRQPVQLPEFIRAITAAENKLLVVNDPQRLHPVLQQALGQAVLQRSIDDGENPIRDLGPMRFAVITPHQPQQIAERQLLDEKLASALGAGLLELPPLRKVPGQVLPWAEAILAAEVALAGLEYREFESSAEAAIQRHRWPGNLAEMQGRIRAALTRTNRHQLNEIDLGLFQLKSVDQSDDERPNAALGNSAGGDLEPLRHAIAEVIELSRHLSAPLEVGNWVQEECLEHALKRYSGHPDPVAKSASFFCISLEEAQRISHRAKLNAASRESLEYWQNSRLATNTWLNSMPCFQEDFRQDLGALLSAPLNSLQPPLPDTLKRHIAGAGLEPYIRD